VDSADQCRVVCRCLAEGPIALPQARHCMMVHCCRKGPLIIIWPGQPWGAVSLCRGPGRGPSHCAGRGSGGRVWLTVPRQARGWWPVCRAAARRPAPAGPVLTSDRSLTVLDSERLGLLASIGVAGPRRRVTWFRLCIFLYQVSAHSWVLARPVTDLFSDYST
jgi:hypothetical protein